MTDAAAQERESLLAGVFPEVWEPAVDVLVVVGSSPPGFFEALLEAGQRRVVEIASHDSLDPPPPAPYARAANGAELFQAVLSFPGPAPTNAAFRCQAGAHFPPELQQSLVQALRGAVSSHKIYQYSVDLHAPQWARQGVANLPRVAELPTTSCLEGAFAGVPCVIASPGPSLTKNVHLLERLRGRGIVMTCTHALAALEAAGVTPDVVAIADPKHSLAHCEGYDTNAPAAFVIDAASHPGNFALGAQRIFTFSTHPSVDEWMYGALSESAFLDSGGSVACIELSLAHQLGCDPIVFVGQDLALTDGRYYAETSVDGGVSTHVTPDGQGVTIRRPSKDEIGAPVVVNHPVEGISEVPAWGGGMVTTSASLNTFLQWFHVVAPDLPARLFNCTEGGAFIQGMEHIPLGECLEQLELAPVDVGSILDRAAAGVDVGFRRERMASAVDDMLRGLEACVEQARTCTRLAGRAANDAAALEDLGRAEGRLSRAIAPLPFLSMLSQSRIRKAQARAESATTLEENLDAALQIFEVVQEAGRTLIAPLRDAREALRD